MCQCRTVSGNLSCLTGRSLAPQAEALQARLFADALGLPTTLSSPSAVQVTNDLQQPVVRRWQCLASFATNQSAASPLRLSGESPDNRRGGTIRFSPLQRAGCEGA